MPKKVQKTLQEYLSKVKSPRHPQIQSAFNSFSSSKNWFLSACKHPKTPSFAFDQPHGSSKNKNKSKDKDKDAATLADIDRFLFENFKSLYLRDEDDDDDDETENIKNTKRLSSSLEEIQDEEEVPKLGSTNNMFESPRLLETPRDIICRSRRFFVKPVLSGSLLIEDGATSSPTSTITNNTDSNSNNSNENHNHNHHHHHHHHQNQALPDNCIALLTSTSSPYEDFKRSMQDVVEARCKKQGSVIDWEFMEELLFCYLNLNEKKSHKFILSAYVDVVTAMRRSSETVVPGKPRSVRTFRFGREVTNKPKELALQFGSSS